MRRGRKSYCHGHAEKVKAITIIMLFLVLPASIAQAVLPGNMLLSPIVLGSIPIKTHVYEGQVILVSPPGIRLVNIEKNIIIEEAMEQSLQKSIFLERPPQTGLQFTVDVQGPTMEDVIRAVDAVNLGYNGENVIVGVIDTGVDFLSKGLGTDKIAMDSNGIPMLFDADEFGLVITPLNVSYRNPYTKMLATKGEYVEIFIPTYGKARIYIDFDWAAPQIESKSGYYKFGFMVAFMFPSNYLLGGSLPGIGYLIPAVMVDSDKPGVYDTVFLDLSTAWFTIGGIFYAFGAIIEPPPIEMLDFSFKDEAALKLGEGVAGIDFDNDGVYDYSLGVISGYVYDAFGIINETTEVRGMTWETVWEPLATGIYPGLDPNGNYFSLFYDPLGHGTSVANIIAGKQSKYFIPSEQGLAIIESIGIAPKAKIAGAMALFVGNVMAALYWLSGHDYINGTWVYTGNHKADIISNSWGILYWPATLLADGPGFPPGSDPLALHLKNITKYSIVVFAAGNEGPGKGSIAMGGASSHVITVGASTIFGEAIYDAFGHLLIPEGLSQGIISWSSRGPNGVLAPKPDVVAPGAYAIVPTALINGLGDGTQAIDIFGGTSMATPVVSGVLALLVDKIKQDTSNASITTADVSMLLKASSIDLGYPSDMQGAGLINASSLLEKVEATNELKRYDVNKVVFDNDNRRLYIELKDNVIEHLTPVLEIPGDQSLIFQETLTLEQYKQYYIDIPVQVENGKGIYKITVSTNRNITEEQLPHTVLWLGGWNESKTNIENQVEKIVLIDHALLNGKQITLYASTGLVDRLESQGLLYNGTMLRLLIFSSIGLPENITIKAYFIPIKEYNGTSNGNTLIFTNISEHNLISKQATIRIGDIRLPIAFSNVLKLGKEPIEIEIQVRSSTHSAYLSGLGDLYIIPIEMQPTDTIDSVIIGYVFTVVKGRADLYLTGEETLDEGIRMSIMKSYYATHPPDYTISKEAYYPYPKSTPGILIAPLRIIENGARLLVYVIDSDSMEDHVKIKVSPIFLMKTVKGGKLYLAVSSETPLGPILLEPSKEIIYHDGGLKVTHVNAHSIVTRLVILSSYYKTFETYVGELGLLTRSFEPGQAIIIEIGEIKTRFTPA